MTDSENRQENKRENKRVHKHMFLLNDAENRALNKYLKKYRVSNKSRFIREALMMTVIKKLEEDSPTLFD